MGYDIHPLEKGRKLVLGGVTVEKEMGLSGHSDGDAVMHAVIDSLLGACGMDSIGELFPETDEYRNADSSVLLKSAFSLLKDRKNLKIINIDIIVITSYVKISEIKNSIKNNLSEILKTETAQINVKGKSGNSLGIGDRGIEVMCTVLADIDVPGGNL
ncbi:MAG: 2-C-methyl-D-erythritol 2,4-cyclodiphosphate synthase [Thermotogae bacterium]|nr:2-C-methyl-D-erythritol 2,4-cyclodiphosphate synthase [Thermotogota bacterium]